MTILDGNKLSQEILARLKQEIFLLKTKGVVPGLGIVLIGANPASELYVSMKQKAAEEVGMKCELVVLSADSGENEIIHVLERMNTDATLHGIIIQLPVPPHLSQERLCSTIDPFKDIDALNPRTLKKMEDGDASVRPPTAEAVKRLIAQSGREILGAHAAVIGSGFFSRQIAYHLKNAGASVEQLPFRSDDLADRASHADIIVTAVGRPESIGPEHIRKGAVVIDVGVSKKDGEVVGDVDFEQVKEKAAAITPVPGGVGPVTVACLLENVVKAAGHLVDA